MVGASDASPEQERVAEEVGHLLAARGVVVVTGGRGGVMAAASRGASSAGGLVIGVLPGVDRAEANPWVTFALPTGLGEMRNALVVRAADALVAVGGAYGTLSEVALALTAGKRVVGVGFSFAVAGVEAADDAASAVALLLGA